MSSKVLRSIQIDEHLRAAPPGIGAFAVILVAHVAIFFALAYHGLAAPTTNNVAALEVVILPSRSTGGSYLLRRSVFRNAKEYP
jgi:hypothetical protein